MWYSDKERLSERPTEQAIYKNEVSGEMYQNEVGEGLSKEEFEKKWEENSVKENYPKKQKPYLEDLDENNKEEIEKYLKKIENSDGLLYEWEIKYYLKELWKVRRIYEGFNGRQISIRLNAGNQWICLSGIKANIENGGYKYAPKRMIEFGKDVKWKLQGSYLEELEDVEIEHTVFNYVGNRIVKNIFYMLIRSAVVVNFEREENKGFIEKVEEDSKLNKEELIEWTVKNLLDEEIIVKSEDLVEFLEEILKKSREKRKEMEEKEIVEKVVG